ncbi:MAG: DUF4124 domain-containing protein [Halopseudomonas sp.]
MARKDRSENPFEPSRALSNILKLTLLLTLVATTALLIDDGRYIEQLFGKRPASAVYTLPPQDQPAAPLSPSGSNRVRRSLDDHSQSCQLVATKPVETVTTKVYRWKDADGVWHFSDRAPTAAQNAVEPTLDRVIHQQKTFSISVDASRAAIPPFLQDRIHRASQALYAFLTTPLQADQIRQADITVHLIGDSEKFLSAYGQLKQGQKMPSGFYTSKTNEAFLLVGRNPKQTQAIAIHETSHVIMAALYQRTPLWLNEGVAEYFEVLPSSVIDNRYQPKPEWIHALRQQGVMPLRSLLTLTGEQWKLMPPERSYANAWGLVYHLMQSQHGRQTLFELLKRVKATPCQPVSSLALIDQHYPGGIDQLQQELSRWLN